MSITMWYNTYDLTSLPAFVQADSATATTSDQLQQVAHHTHRPHRRTRTRSLHDERACPVPCRMKHDDVVRSPKRSSERVRHRVSGRLGNTYDA